MKIDLVTAVGLAAVFLMLVNLFFTVSMRSRVRDKSLGEGWNYMTVLVLMFTAAYFVLPFIGSLSVESLRIIVSMIFLFGALYVMLTLRMIHGMIRQLSS